MTVSQFAATNHLQHSLWGAGKKFTSSYNHLNSNSRYSAGKTSNPLLNRASYKNLVKASQQLLEQLQSSKQGKKSKFRSIDGSGNNRRAPDLGKTGSDLTRLFSADYSREPGGATESSLPSAREVSNAVSTQTESIANKKGLSDMFWLWGQFLDHDITLVHADTGAKADIQVPKGDQFFDPLNTGNAKISFTRSDSYQNSQGTTTYQNSITSFIDGSNVYGSDQKTADSLRSFEGGKLLVSEGNLLPLDDNGHFIAGDVRSNEHAGLTAMHTLWVREHNRIAEQIADRKPRLSDEKVYQKARRKVIAQMQAITYNEFLPALLGEDALKDYQGYNKKLSPAMTNAFSVAAFRLGHTMLSPTLLRLDENGNEIDAGHLNLRDAFFQPSNVTAAGIDPILRGFAAQTAQAVDPFIIDDVRNFLFGQPGQGGFDLASLNIQRGRDHALPSLNDARQALGLYPISSFSDPAWRDGVGEKLAQVYESPDDIDLWVGGLAEKSSGDSLVGETFTAVLADQFTRLRDADRFWYEKSLNPKQIAKFNRTSLSDVISRNSGIRNIQDNAFLATRGAAEFGAQPAIDEQEVVGMRMMGAMAPAFSQDDADQATDLPAEQIRQLDLAIKNGQLG